MPMFGPPNIVKLQQKRNIDGLIKALSYKDSDVRFAAAFAVGRIGDPRAIPPLTTALNDENLNVREAAAIALGEIGDPQAIPALITALNDKDSNVRRLAVRALGEIGDPQAIPPLITALDDQNQDVRKAAAGALDTLHWSPGRDATGVAYWMGKGDWDRCVKIGVPAIEPLTKALNHRDLDLRRAAAAALGRIKGPRAIPPLITALNDHDGDVRRAAADALHMLHWSPGRDATGVAYWMGKGNWDRCVEIGIPAIEPLTKALNHRDLDVRRAAAAALGTIGDPQAIPALITALNDQDWHVRKAAVHALGAISDPQAIPPLITALNDEVCCSHRTVTQEGRISPEEEGSLCRNTVSSPRSTATKRC